MRITRFALASAISMFAVTAANAADLGGNCCADLEERIAELEATTARKGNRKVSLTVSGFVGHNILFWDDGKVGDMYIGDGGNYFSRFRFTGNAKITPDVTAGFTYEFGVHGNNIGGMSQIQGPNITGSGTGATGNGDDNGYQTQPMLRDSTVWLRSARLGMVKLGQGSTATDNLVLIDLGMMQGASTPDTALYIGGFRLRDAAGNISNTSWQNVIRGHESWDTFRRNHIMYETPTLHGFNVQTAVGEDNYWDIALRFANEWNGVRVAFGIGYQVDSEFNNSAGAGFLCGINCDLKSKEVKGSASILHVPTGLFLTGAAGNREYSGDSSVVGGIASKDASFWYLAGGISRNFTGFGRTTIFGEYSESKNAASNPLGGFMGVSTTVTHWGIGVNQYFDAAAFEMFITYKNFSLDLPANVALVGIDPLVGAPVVMGAQKDLSALMIGAKMSF